MSDNKVSFYVEGLNVYVDLSSAEDICEKFGGREIPYKKFMGCSKDEYAKLRRGANIIDLELPMVKNELTETVYDLFCEQAGEYYNKYIATADEEDEESDTESEEPEEQESEEVTETESIEETASAEESIETETNNCVAAEAAESEDVIMSNVSYEVNGAVVEDVVGAVKGVEPEVADKAKDFAENAKDKVEDAAKYIYDKFPSMRAQFKKLANMSTAELQAYLKKNADDLMAKIKKALKDNKSTLGQVKSVLPGADSEIKHIDNILITFQDIMDDDQTKGWGKIKAIVKALVMWILHIILKVIAVLLKVAVIALVGTVKVGAVLIDSLFSICGVTVSGVKSAAKHGKALKQKKAAAQQTDDTEDDDDDEIQNGFEAVADDYMDDLESNN